MSESSASKQGLATSVFFLAKFDLRFSILNFGNARRHTGPYGIGVGGVVALLTPYLGWPHGDHHPGRRAKRWTVLTAAVSVITSRARITQSARQAGYRAVYLCCLLVSGELSKSGVRIVGAMLKPARDLLWRLEP